MASTRSPCREGTLAADDYVRCPHDAVGRYRIEPDYGEPVTVWLCDDHHQEYRERIVETLAVL